MGKLWRRLRALGGRRRQEQELAEELADHLARQADALAVTGRDPEAARREARRRFGNPVLIAERCRDERRLGWLEDLARDLRLAARSLRRAPGFAAAVGVVLALGIGGNVALFSLVDAVFLRPLPYPGANRIAWSDSLPLAGDSLLAPDADRDWSGRPPFAAVASYLHIGFTLTLTGGGRAEALPAAEVTGGFFATLGIQPRLGREFSAAEAGVAGTPAAIVSDGLWRRELQSNPAVVGRSVTLDGRLFRIVGVMPPGFRFPGHTEIWLPPQSDAFNLRAMHVIFYSTIARLRPEVSWAAAQAAVNRRLAEIAVARHVPSPRATIVPLGRHLSGGELRPAALLLWLAEGFLLLLACANAANLLLARQRTRRHEAAIRAALGAGKMALLRHGAAECLLLAAAGGLLGTAGAFAAWRFAGATVPADWRSAFPVQFDVRVLVAAVAATLVTAILAGVFPSLIALRLDPQREMAGTTCEAASGGSRHAATLLMGGQVALALVLLVGAGLLIHSFARLTDGRWGFDPNHLLTAALPPAPAASAAARAAARERILERVRRLPGVEGAGLTTCLPFGGGPYMGGGLRPGSERPIQFLWCKAGSGFFAAMRIPVVEGRDFAARDLASVSHPVIASRSFARRYLHGEPLGQVMPLGMGGRKFIAYRVVGVTGDVRQIGWAGASWARYLLYEPLPASEAGEVYLAVRSAGKPAALAAAMRQAVAGADPNQPVADVRTMRERLAADAAAPRFRALLLALFAALALLLAAMGICGVLAYYAARRTHEIGLRMALGARREQVTAQLLREGLAPVGGGFVVGLLAALGVTRLLRGFLYGVAPLDPASLAAAVALLGLVALAACYAPARRATAVDPAQALRRD